MSILSQKQKVFGNIAAFRTLTEGLPQLKLNSSFPSINNNGDTVTFLCDLIKALIGYDALQETVIDTLTYNMKDIEREVKNALRVELKSIVSCGVDPSLPAFMKSTGNGLKFTVNKIDFTGLMMVNPNSDTGKLLYNDRTTNLIDSTDFNTFLYQTIQNDGSTESWGHTTTDKDIITVRFKSIDVSQIDPNNTLTIKAHPLYDTKTLTDLNNDYVDSVSLFNTEKLLSNIVDMVFGSISTVLNKPLIQLENEAKINTVINRIVNSDNKDIINDKYFEFSNQDRMIQGIEANSRKNGIKNLSTSIPLITSIPMTTLSTANNLISGANNLIEKRVAVASSLNSMGNQITSFVTDKTDHESLKLNFIQEIINNIVKAIVNTILSPKVVTIFMINYKIIYGQNATFTDPVDFLKKNKNLVHNITKRVNEVIVKTLLNIALKKIAELVSAGIAKQQIDKAQANLTQLLSLVGVPQDTLRQIKGLL
jgi:hypothetical protein